MPETSTQWWEIGHLHDHRSGPRPAGPDVPLRLRAVRHAHAAAGLPDDRERLLPHARTSPTPARAARCGCAPATSGTSRRWTRATSPTRRHAGHGRGHPQGPGDRRAAGHGRVGGRGAVPGRRTCRRDAEIADYIRQTHNTVYHPAGTVRMGAADDAMSPLDPELRVKGVDRAARRRRLGHARAHHGEPEHHHDDDRGALRGTRRPPGRLSSAPRIHPWLRAARGAGW